MRKSILAGATALAVAATGLAVTGITGATRSASAAIGDVPADCQARATAYRSDGQRLTYKYAAQQTSTEALPGDNLGWVPTALAPGADAGGADSWTSSSLVTHPTDGYLYLLQRAARRVDGEWKITKHTTTRLASGFAGTRILAEGRFPFYYRVAGKSLYRFQVIYSADKPPTISTPVKMPGDAWDTVNTLRYRRTGGTAAAPVHVLAGTKTNGQLKEWKFTETTPATVTSTVLRDVGWAGFTSLNTGFCNSHPNGGALLAVTAAGRASVHFDANATDSSGTDIKGGSIGSVGWTEKTY
ncbi:hypothetical protein [Kribbella speibonae]|uniref:Uncharacterized protein n=1 Tax=Kribbella speibonae TaxID=1572660 RepID=A0A4R0J3K7_9ACTN|nr:hypothetical protein [Kribbella speibonae]TCC21117.1 hypothetical protein E0H58_27740 [Kribbella speibonae]TCC41123.1 hypothetical protein E0H92_05500 [Kribbella speibonae]